MPIYEYRCEECGRPFAERRPIDQRDAETACPSCAGTHVVRLVSTFAAFSAGESGTVALNSSPCSGCASTGGCATCQRG